MTARWMRSGGLVLAVLIACTLTACADEDPPRALSGGGSSSAENSGESEEVSTETQEAEETEVSSPGPAECLLGEWEANNPQFAVLMTSLMEGSGTVDSVTGEVVLSLAADGSTSTSYADWTLVMTAEGQTVTIVRNGLDSGVYALDEGSLLTMTETVPASTVAMSAAGIDMGTIAATDTLPLTRAPFACSDGLLTIETDSGEITFSKL